MGLKVEMSNNRNKLKRQIEALEWQLTQDTRDEDRRIHQDALDAIKKRLLGI